MQMDALTGMVALGLIILTVAAKAGATRLHSAARREMFRPERRNRRTARRVVFDETEGPLAAQPLSAAG